MDMAAICTSTLSQIVCGGIAISLILFGHILKGVPMKEVGRSTNAGRSTRVLGYDNLRGQFSDLAVAVFTVVALSATHILLPLPWFIWPALYALYSLFSRPTSMPRPARARRIFRKPSWLPGARTFDVGSWMCAIANNSHEATEAELGNKLSLTGESCGRQTWHHTQKQNQPGEKCELVFDPSINPNSSDKAFRAQQLRKWKLAHPNDAVGASLQSWGKAPSTKAAGATAAMESAFQGIAFYQKLQCDDGHWAGDYGGPHFLMPGLVITWYITGKRDDLLPLCKRQLMAHYLRCHQQADGGWGTHIESPSTMFGAVLCYVALRLLTHSLPTQVGSHAEADEVAFAKAQKFIRENGGALYTASWAKFYLCLLGVMEWEGHNSVPPEMFLLPDYFPFHPGRLWCHCRMVYLPMCYLYGIRFVYDQADSDPLVRELRRDLYSGDGSHHHPYSTDNGERNSRFDWSSTRNLVADTDNYSPIPATMRVLQGLLAYFWEPHHLSSSSSRGTSGTSIMCAVIPPPAFSWLPLRPLGYAVGWLRDHLRAKGLAIALDYMYAEDEQTNYLNIGPVNKVPTVSCYPSSLT
jgi:hypothetical protein